MRRNTALCCLTLLGVLLSVSACVDQPETNKNARSVLSEADTTVFS
jgi:hypothetical protein